MAGESERRTTTILFTDLVNSTELMQRAGDEDAQRIFRAHYQLLRDAVSANGGAEVKSLGDGLMVEFNSAADAVRCAIVMQQSSRRSASTERLAIRVGINTGDALRDEGDLFGTPVVVARRLCDRAGPGQILCSAVVEGLLAGRQAFAFADVGSLELKGITTPVAAREVVFEHEQPGALLTRTPFVGRMGEMERLRQRLDETKAGRGGLVFLVGEPGIGKSRTIEEFCEYARESGAIVLAGRCFEGEWAPPYGPFAEAIAGYAKDADASELSAALGYGAPPIARLAPVVRERLPDIEEPAPLQPDEERFRLLDAVAQFVIALSQRAPIVLVLDDLHWADRGTIAMLRHVARFAPKHRLLILGAYRDIELDRQHPLSDALAQLRREAEYERIALKGLARDDVGTMLQTIAEQEVNAALVQAISDETDGNPFFIHEVLIHLVAEGKLYREDGAWRSSATSIADLGIPEGVRQVITRRLSRLSDTANRLLTAASGFNGEFRFQTVGTVAGLDEAATLDAIDEALGGQILRSADRADHYDFTHALIRHTLYGEMNPSRQVRLHRQIAEALEARVATYTPERQATHAGELAYQYHRSAAIPGAERGVEFALQAAEVMEETYAWDEAARYLSMALDLLLQEDTRRPRLLARYAVALGRTLRFDDAVSTAIDAGRALANSEGSAAAVEFFADTAAGFSMAGSLRAAWQLAQAGLMYTNARDIAWSRLAIFDVQRREAENPDSAGTALPLDAPERDDIVSLQRSLPIDRRVNIFNTSRAEVLAHAASYEAVGSQPGSFAFTRAFELGWQAGEFRRARGMFEEDAREEEAGGRIAVAAGSYAMLSRCHAALGDLREAGDAYQHALALGGKLAGDPLLGAQSLPAQQVIAALDELTLARGTHTESVDLARALVAQDQPELRWARSVVDAATARILADAGMADEALTQLNALARRIDRIPETDANLTRTLCDAAHALWSLQRTDHLAAIERNLQDKVLAPDFRYPMVDARHAMGRLCAVSGRHDEAVDWFSKARDVLDEQGARPLRAIVDYDEALMYIRRGADRDRERARPLLNAALVQFREIGMTGWTTRAEELRARID